MEYMLHMIEIGLLIYILFRKDVSKNGLQKEKEDKVNLLNTWFYGVKHR